jgi:hypothetical protein
MCPDWQIPDWQISDWQTVDRLLCCFNPIDAEPLTPVLQTLRQVLPNCSLTLLGFDSSNQVTPAEAKVAVAAIWDWTISADIPKPAELNAEPLSSPQMHKWEGLELIRAIRDRAFDAAICFTRPDQSPYALAYLCYLAGVPIRIGQSREFGGGVLSTCITPPLEAVSPIAYFLHLLESLGFSADLIDKSKMLGIGACS